MATDAVEQIKERLSIVDVVSQYVQLQQAGKNFKGKSPFTNERTPSFYVSPDRGMYYCFSSNQGGDIFTFVEKMEGVDFKEALRILAQKAGVQLVAEDPKKKTERDRMHEALEEATRFFENSRRMMSEIDAYLKDRGVTEETITKWRIGYAPNEWRALKAHLEKKGFTVQELLKAGLIKSADAGKEPYDLFRDRVTFPIFDAQGRAVAFSGRIFSKVSDAPKYVNSPETDLFNKSEILYGYDKAKQGIRSLDFTLVVEGQFDVVLSHQAGYTNAVAVSGTALTAHHVMLLQRLSNRVVLSLDADRAGIAAVKRAAHLMLPRGMDIKVAQMQGGKDPADMVREDVQKFRKIIGSAKPVIEYLLDTLEAEKKDDRSFKLRVREEVLPVLVRIANKIDQDHFEGVIAQRLNTTKEAIHYETERYAEKAQEESTPEAVSAIRKEQEETKSATESQEHRQEALSRYLAVLHTLCSGPMQKSLGEAFFAITTKTPQAVADALDLSYKSGLSFTLESYLADTPHKQVCEDIADKLNELLRHYTRSEVLRLKAQLREAEETGDEEAVTQHLQAISEAQKRLEGDRYTAEHFKGVS